ncbi:hypothetical protein HORIV_28540 [Vreelandella olivaria]|uniref:Uncharacterized protein n=1 Tax=Vreelandella olivaria TaxID=390919 RepID=A0ABM7GID2_9GAMM|nr:hypothetical protein HORIV_28540 [Halomonas olivaria]
MTNDPSDIGVQVDAGKGQHEFIARDTRHQVGDSLALSQSPSQLNEQTITLIIAKGIIDLDEVIDVQVDGCQAIALASTGIQQTVQVDLEGLAVREMGEPVEMGGEFQVTVGALLVGKIDIHAEHQGGVGMLIEHQMLRKDRYQFTGFVLEFEFLGGYIDPFFDPGTMRLDHFVTHEGRNDQIFQ